MSDSEAERAIRDAFEELELGNQPCNSRTVPEMARQILNDRGPERIIPEIEAMEKRGQIEAPLEPYKEWRLLA